MSRDIRKLVHLKHLYFLRVSRYRAALRNMFAPLQRALKEPDRRVISTPAVNYHGSVYMRHVFSRDRRHLCSLKTDSHYVPEKYCRKYLQFWCECNLAGSRQYFYSPVPQESSGWVRETGKPVEAGPTFSWSQSCSPHPIIWLSPYKEMGP